MTAAEDARLGDDIERHSKRSNGRQIHLASAQPILDAARYLQVVDTRTKSVLRE